MRDSILNTSKYFHVTEGLVPDIMHDVLEGCAPYEVKELLKYLDSNEIASLGEVNNKIEHFLYASSDVRNKPTIIPSTVFKSSDHSVKQKGTNLFSRICTQKLTTSNVVFRYRICDFIPPFFAPMFLAAQMWCLCRLLPLMIGNLVPETDSRWINFLQLLEIVDLLFAPVLSNDHVAYLHFLIEEHHQIFTDLYPDCSITPKFHYMVHYPHWISRYNYTYS